MLEEPSKGEIQDEQPAAVHHGMSTSDQTEKCRTERLLEKVGALLCLWPLNGEFVCSVLVLTSPIYLHCKFTV